MNQEYTIGIVGLGNVGLPLAVEFSMKFPTVGFDINSKRIEELRSGVDRTLEVSSEQLASANGLSYTDKLESLRAGNVFIVTVPTPIDQFNRPDLALLLTSSEHVGKVLKQGDIVIYESTVYPGCTEEDCVPVLERVSGLTYNTDFFCGYSPERISPGDKEHTVTKIEKVTSGSTPEVADQVDAIYREVITAATHKASSIMVAEASKIIENSQRDVNIAFMNELALIFDRMGIDTLEVIEAAGTKWNFLSFRPGFVGGHCIGVDPFYMTHKAESLGYRPQVILSGRSINDSMPVFVANKVVKLMIKKGPRIESATILVLGVTFKENCPDIRNSKVPDLVRELQEFGCLVTLVDPWAESADVRHKYGLDSLKSIDQKAATIEAIVVAVAHDESHSFPINEFAQAGALIFDVKGLFPKTLAIARL